uniref:Uncharacterized protein n=1 Tax=Melopsittacus undulatus TaxID=13146 RepID=A0A8V5GU18_MELUD
MTCCRLPCSGLPSTQKGRTRLTRFWITFIFPLIPKSDLLHRVKPAVCSLLPKEANCEGFIEEAVHYHNITAQPVLQNKRTALRTCEERLLFGGGEVSECCLELSDDTCFLDTRKEQWVAEIPLPARQSHHCVALLGSFIFIAGGSFSRDSGGDAASNLLYRLQGAEEERSREPAAAEAALESGPGDQVAAGAGLETRRERLPVEELGPVEEWKEAAAEQREQAAEEPSPATKPSSATAESIPQKLPAEPQHDAGDHAAFPSKAEEEDLDLGKEKLVVGELASTAATSAPVTAASFESSEGFEWPLGTLGTCLLIVMGIGMLAHTQCVLPTTILSDLKS